MTITIPDDLYALLQQNAMLSGVSVDEYLAQLIRYAGSAPVEDTTETEEDRAEIDAALEEAEAEDESDYMDAREFLENFRARHGL